MLLRDDYGSHALVSIIIPVYNGSNYLREAVDSALAQTYPHCEVLVVNDGSDDGGATEAIALSYGERVRYFSKANGGVASALNMGIEQMRGEYVSWLSHDDVYLPDKCRAQVELCQLHAHKSIVVYAHSDVIDVDGHRSRGTELPDLDGGDAFFRIWGWSFLNGCTMLLPRKVLLEAGGFREDLPTTQDYDLWLRLTEIVTYCRLPQTVLLSRRHPGQGSRMQAHKRECVALLRAYVPALLVRSRRMQGGFQSVSPLVAQAIVRRITDYGFTCAKALWSAFSRHATQEECCLLLFYVLLQSPYGFLRWVWVRQPFKKSLFTFRTVNESQIDLKHKFYIAMRQGGMRAALQKTFRYVCKVANQWQRVLLSVAARPENLPARQGETLCLIVDHAVGGGACAYREHKVKLLLTQNWSVLIWQYLAGAGCYAFEWRCGAAKKHFMAQTLEKSAAFIHCAAPQEIFLNSVVGWPRLSATLELLTTLQATGAKLEFFVHDYFAVCPAYPLLDKAGCFCGLPMPPQPCERCLPKNYLAAPHDTMDIYAWRRMWGDFLCKVDALSAPDTSVKELFSRVYASTAQKITIVPHSPLCIWNALPALPRTSTGVIGVIGHIARHKGAGIVEDLVRLIAQKKLPLRVVVIGVLESSLRHPLLHVTGSYSHELLPELIMQHKITSCLVPSPLPETFCYVAQEVEMLGLPLVCFDLGAQGARARCYAKGFVAPTQDAHGCLVAILQAHIEHIITAQLF